MNPLLEHLNAPQLAAVTLPPHHALILAGAGSGKTRVLTTRIAWLISTGQVAPPGILAVTFTNKAAKEMLTRLAAMLPINVKGMWIGTFHGLCNRLLRTHYRDAGLPQLFQILDVADQQAAIKRMLKNLDVDDEKFPPRELAWFFNAQKEAGLRPAQVVADDDWSRRRVALYEAYEAQCQREGVVDFAELLLRAYELLERNEPLRRHYQERFRHILVDEFQDTNKLQYLWLKLLAGSGASAAAGPSQGGAAANTAPRSGEPWSSPCVARGPGGMRMTAQRLFSHDLPRSRLLAVLLVVVLVGLLVAPFALPGAKVLNVAAKLMVFVLLVASFDLLLGYGGIVSFAHTMFFGIGAYGVAIACARMGAHWGAIAVGSAAALALSLLLALVIALFGLRVRALFFAMITLAVASAFQTIVSQFSHWTGGEDGLNFPVPRLLTPAFRLFDAPLFGVLVNGRLLTYYLIFAVVLVSFLVLLRLVNSPYGRVLQAIRENEFRAAAIGYPVLWFRATASAISALFATLAGILLALWLRYSGPDVSLSFEVMTDVLLIVVIGGMGTLFGAVVGAALFIAAQNYLQDLLRLGSEAAADVAPLAAILSPDRWLLWLGLLFIVSVYRFPFGIVGTLRRRAGG